MESIGDRKFIDIPGQGTHELPPLLVSAAPVKRLDKVVNLASTIVETEDMIASPAVVIADEAAQERELGRRRMDLAINLAEQYLGLVKHWKWGDAVLEWIRQCEITFETRSDLKHLLRNDVWPHAGRVSFVTLLADKAVPTEGVNLERAVGLRLSFRQPPPLSCCSNQFLLYLNSTVANSAFNTWSSMNPAPISALPPERFHVEVVNMAIM